MLDTITDENGARVAWAVHPESPDPCLQNRKPGSIKLGSVATWASDVDNDTPRKRGYTMLKLISLTFVLLYGSFCFHTMPRSCIAINANAIECQRVQLNAMYDFRNVDWSVVASVKRF